MPGGAGAAGPTEFLLDAPAPNRQSPRVMNKSLIKYLLPSFAVVAAILIGASTFGGPAPVEKNVMPAPPSCDWSGFYIGLNVGVAGLHTNITDLDDWFDPFTNTIEDTNVAAGGQMGYNWQMGSFVFGIEADADYLNTECTHTDLADQETPAICSIKPTSIFRGACARVPASRSIKRSSTPPAVWLSRTQTING